MVNKNEDLFRISKDKIEKLEMDIINIVQTGNIDVIEKTSDAKIIEKVKYECRDKGLSWNEIAYVFFRIGEVMKEKTMLKMSYRKKKERQNVRVVMIEDKR